MTDKREYLRKYLNASLASLFASGAIRPTDSVDVIVRAAINQFALDVGTDVRVVLAEIGRTVAQRGIQYAEVAAKDLGTQLINGAATYLKNKIDGARRT